MPLTFEKLQFEFVPANYVDGYISFANDISGSILKKIQSVEHITLTEKEVANGIHPHYDFINKKLSAKSKGVFKVGDGIFGLSHKEFRELELEEKVKQKENEFANAEKYIAEADDEYYNEKKREFRKETLFKLFEKTNNTYNM